MGISSREFRPSGWHEWPIGTIVAGSSKGALPEHPGKVHMRQTAIFQYIKANLFLPVMLSLAHLAVAQSLVIENGILIDGNGGPPINGAVVIVEGDKISAVSQKGQVPYPRGTKIIDAVGKF